MTLKQIRFEPDARASPFITFDENTKTISYDGDPSVVTLNDQGELDITVTLINDVDQETIYDLIFVVPCPIA